MDEKALSKLEVRIVQTGLRILGIATFLVFMGLALAHLVAMVV